MKRFLAITAGALLLASTVYAAPEVDLLWTTGDTENPQEGYVVYRRLMQDTAVTEIGRTGKLVTEFTDTTVQKNNVYCWTVRAFLGTDVSQPSNEACALVLQNKIKLSIN